MSEVSGKKSEEKPARRPMEIVILPQQHDLAGHPVDVPVVTNPAPKRKRPADD